jgi:hypothetical protein
MKKPGLVYFDRAEFNRSFLEAIQKPVEEVCLTDRMVGLLKLLASVLFLNQWFYLAFVEQKSGTPCLIRNIIVITEQNNTLFIVRK